MTMVTPLCASAVMARQNARRASVDAAGRFVQEQDLRLVQQARRHGQALLVAAGQRPLTARGQAELVHHRGHALAPGLAAQVAPPKNSRFSRTVGLPYSANFCDT